MSWPFRSGIIFNPGAGRNRRSAPKVLAALRKIGPVQVVSDPKDIETAIHDFARRGIDHLIISAGDGTVQACLTALFLKKAYSQIPPISVLPGGTTNLIAADVGPHGGQISSVERALKLMECHCLGNLYWKKRPLIRLSASNPSEKAVTRNVVRYGMFLGAGAISKAVRFYQERLHETGLWGAPGIALTIFRYLWLGLFSRQPNQARLGRQKGISQGLVSNSRITIDGKKALEGPTLLVLVTTLNRLFAGIKPFWQAEEKSPIGERPLKMTVIMNRPAKFLRALPSLIRGRNSTELTQENGYASFRFSRAELQIQGPVALDGELIDPAAWNKPSNLRDEQKGKAAAESSREKGSVIDETSQTSMNCYTLEYGGQVSFVYW